jgi:acetate---CoA ligase (ADP-forming)
VAPPVERVGVGEGAGFKETTIFRSPEWLFRSKSVAIVGASERPGSWSRILFDNLQEAGFPGSVYLINPRRESAFGVRCYPDFAHLPDVADVALVVVDGQFVPDVLVEGKAHGLRSAVLYAENFGDKAGDTDRRARVVALCDGPDGLRVSGHNGMGTIGLRERTIFYPQSPMRNLPAGDIGVISSSGGSLQHLLSQGAVRGLGFSYAVSSGAELDLDLADYLNFLVEDPSTKTICALIEGVRRPDAFVEVARRALALRKPILVMKIGRSAAARAAVVTHTGALAGDDVVFSAVCERYGIIRCVTLGDLIEGALAFRTGRFPDGSGLGVVCHSGGVRGMFLDAADDGRVALSAFASETERELRKLEPNVALGNPLDAGGRVAEASDRFEAVCRVVADDPGVKVLVLQGRLPVNSSARHPASLYAAIAGGGKPVIAFERIAYNLADDSRAFQAETTVPFLQGIPETVRVVRALTAYSRRARLPVPRALPQLRAQEVPGDPEAVVFETLWGNGVDFPHELIAHGRNEAVEAARRIGYPVAVKIATRDALHKTDVDGVRLGLRDDAQVAAAVDVMNARLQARTLDTRFGEYRIQEMVDGLELLVGARIDPQYGPVLIVGWGGIYTEAFDDTTVRLLPVGREDIAAMLGSLRIAQVLAPFRGRPERDTDALIDAIHGVATTFIELHSWLDELEVNPLIVGASGSGARAVDVRLVTRQREG